MNVPTALRPAAIPLLALALVACAGQSGPNPPQIEYMFESDVVLQADQFAAGTRLLPYFVGSVTQNGTPTSVLHSESFPVSASGTATIELDARDIPPEISARDLVSYWLMGQEAGDTVSDESARLRVILGVGVLQYSIDGESSMYSHLMSPLHQYMFNGAQARAPTLLVFSDVEVSIEATRTFTEPAFTSTIDIRLAAGWNLVYREAAPGSNSLFARPVAASDRFVALGPQTWLAADAALAADVVGWSLVSRHLRNQADGLILNVGAGFNTQSTVRIFANSWITPGSTRLASAEEALGFDGFTFTGTPPDGLELAAGTLLGYEDDDTKVENWWRQPGLSSVDIELHATDGSRVLPVYSNQAATLHFTGSLNGSPVATAEGGLELGYGWNHVLMTRDGTGNISLSIHPGGADGIGLRLVLR